ARGLFRFAAKAALLRSRKESVPSTGLAGHLGHTPLNFLFAQDLGLRGDIPIVATHVSYCTGTLAVELVFGLLQRGSAGFQCLLVHRVDVGNVDVKSARRGWPLLGAVRELHHGVADTYAGVGDASAWLQMTSKFLGAQCLLQEIQEFRGAFHSQIWR